MKKREKDLENNPIVFINTFTVDTFLTVEDAVKILEDSINDEIIMNRSDELKLDCGHKIKDVRAALKVIKLAIKNKEKKS